MKQIIFTLILAITSSFSYAVDGYVHGNNHCFYFSSPDGWVADNISGKRSGLPFVFYPQESSWAEAITVIYARVIDKSEKIQKPEDVVNDTLNLFHTKYQSPNTMAEKEESYVSNSGTSSVIYKFTGDRFENNELATYFVGEKTINYFVMSSRDENDLARNKSVLIELGKTYREAHDCVPCNKRTHNQQLNLTQNANALCSG